MADSGVAAGQHAGESAAHPQIEAIPPAATVLFGDRLPLAEQYAGSLAGDGVLRGVIGPREADRIWSRHVLNCAVLTELFAPGVRVVDVGSGAGLPGIVLALRRPDLRVDLVEPLQRRIDYLTDVVVALGLTEQVRVVRGRADERSVRDEVGGAAWVTARAVAPLDRLVRWCLPLLAPSGRLALMKGASAADELAQHRSALSRAGAAQPEIVQCGADVIDPPVTVVTMGVRPRRSARGSR
jgi:16S rRNA (guanine527-N7)-methyltransferase